MSPLPPDEFAAALEAVRALLAEPDPGDMLPGF
ncbi:MAG: hypothetical protein K0S70_98 [Microbacterium sp.]|jgi:hypothetical protein|nr:hypothetical protein [Microbacterium sp.]